MKKHHLPPPDEDLAAAERTENMRQQRAIDDQAEEDRAGRLARAGEPEAQEALRATAAFLHSQPLEPPKSRTSKLKLATAPALPAPKESEADTSPPAPLTADQEAAFRLMHLAFQKWGHEYRKKPQEANIELAVNLGRDTAIYLKNGIWKVADALDAISKLTGMTRRGGQEPEAAEDYDAAIDKLRAEMRG